MSDSQDARNLARDTNSLIEHAARREEILAGTGKFPEFDELQRGLPFHRGDFLLDVKTFIGTGLLEPGLSTKTKKALSLASSNPTASTLRAASDSLESTTHQTARRLDLYAAWMGDPTGRDRTIRRGFEDLRQDDVSDVSP